MSRRRDSLDDFKEESFRPVSKKILTAQQSQSKPAATSKPSEPVASTSTSAIENNDRICALCNVQLSESKYAEHFAACMKQRAAKQAAASRAAAAASKSKVRPITDFIQVKSSSSGKTTPQPPSVTAPADAASLTPKPAVPDASTIVLPYCPVCGRVIKTERSYASHMKQCAKKYNVAPDLLLELSKKQMTLHQKAEPMAAPASKPTSVGKKRPAKFFEMPSSFEDEQLQLAVALSASVIETHVSHLPVAPASITGGDEQGMPKRMKRQNSVEFPIIMNRDPAAAQIRLLELINQRLLTSPTKCVKMFDGEALDVIKTSRLGSLSQLFHLTCSGPESLLSAIKASNSSLDMPAEFHIDTCDFEFPFNVCDIIAVAKGVEDNNNDATTNQEETEDSQNSDHTNSMFVDASTFAHSPSNGTITTQEEEEAPNETVQTMQTVSVVKERIDIGTSPIKITLSRQSFVDQGVQTDNDKVEVDDSNDKNQNASAPRLSLNFLRLLDDKSTCDIQLISSDGSLVAAHRLVLFSQCPGLISKSSLMKVGVQPSLVISRLSSYSTEFIQLFLKFVYSGVVKHPELEDEITHLYDSLQFELPEEQEDSSAGNDMLHLSFNHETPAKSSHLVMEQNDSPQVLMSDSLILAVATADSPSDDNYEIDGFPTSTSEGLRLLPDSPIVISSSSHVDTCDQENDTDSTADVPGLDMDVCGNEPLEHDVVDIVSDESSDEINATLRQTELAIGIDQQEPEIPEVDVPQPQIGDEWLGFENPNYEDDIYCYQSELPLSQQPITEQENDLIAEFIRIHSDPENDTENEVPAVVTVDIDEPGTSNTTPTINTSPVIPPLSQARNSLLISANNNKATIPRSLKRKTPVTPAASFLQQRTRSLTTPPYSQMATPNLVKLLSKYGVRKLPKRHMVLKLKEIHSVLKPKTMAANSATTSNSENIADSQVVAPVAAATTSKKPKAIPATQPAAEFQKPLPHWKSRCKKKFSTSSSSSSSEDEVGDGDSDEDDAEVTLEPNALSLLDDMDDDDEEDHDAIGGGGGDNANDDDDVAMFFSQSQTVYTSQATTASQVAAKRAKKPKKVPKIVATGEEFVEKVAAFIRSDRELYADLLQFKPLPFKDIYAKVRKVGNFACSKQQLVDFLDAQCITFRLTPGKSHRPPPPPPEKKPKQPRAEKKK